MSKHHTAKQVIPCGWGIFTDPLEILPFDDILEHHGGEECRCLPVLDEDNVIVHNAFDRREDYVERGRKRN